MFTCVVLCMFYTHAPPIPSLSFAFPSGFVTASFCVPLFLCSKWLVSPKSVTSSRPCFPSLDFLSQIPLCRSLGSFPLLASLGSSGNTLVGFPWQISLFHLLSQTAEGPPPSTARDPLLGFPFPHVFDEVLASVWSIRLSSPDLPFRVSVAYFPILTTV